MSVAFLKDRFRSAARPLISVHRGLWGPLPENSLPAIQAASQWDIIEVDVRRDGDGRSYLMHDRTLRRTTGCDLASDGANAHRLSELTLLEGAGGGNAAMTECSVPSLREAFETLSGSDAIFDLDVKHAFDIAAVAAEVAELGRARQACLKIDVTSQDGIRALEDLEAAFDVMVAAKVQLDTPLAFDILRGLRSAGQALVEVGFETVSQLEEAAEIGGDEMRLSVYTLEGVCGEAFSDTRAIHDPEAVWGRLLRAGATVILTDEAEALSRFSQPMAA